MTETIEEKLDSESNGRKRYSLKSFSHLLKDSDDSDDSNDSEESNEDSDDEWDVDTRKKKRRNRNIPIPARTLKKKLAEKTKALRKNACKSHVESSKSQPEEVNIKTEISTLKPPKSENIVELEKTDTNVKMENNVSKIEVTTSDIKIQQVETVSSDIKIILSETVTKLETPKKNEPVVITYSTVKNSSNISPFLLNSISPSEFSTPVKTSNPDTIIPPSISSVSSSSLPSPSISSSIPSPSISTSVPSPSISTSVPSPSTYTSVPAPSVSSSSISSSLPSPSNKNLTPAPRIRVKSNFQAASPFRGSAPRPCRPVSSPIIFNSPQPRMRTPTPRAASRIRSPRTPQPSQRSPVSPISSKLNRTRKPSSSPIPISHSRPLGSPSPTVPRTTTNVGPTLNFKDSNSLKNISSSGTVIYRGSNSVTITPKKVPPERPPVQRKLFRNEIEGIIAVRHENGVMKYVVNLANGTHMPLTDLQVTKLREQNGGRLPPKLRIPVPSDVAAKIEPSYLIED